MGYKNVKKGRGHSITAGMFDDERIDQLDSHTHMMSKLQTTVGGAYDLRKEYSDTFGPSFHSALVWNIPR